jgi:Lon protease-like protein
MTADAALMAGGPQHFTRPLPDSLPLFPLTGVLLLPRGLLPLNIFEPRYLNMVDDALAGDRLIGMIQPLDAAPSGFNPPLYKTGCAGRIVSFAEEGERYIITLVGVCRFDIGEAVTTSRLYRRAEPAWKRYRDDLAASTESPQIDRKRLLAGLRPFFQTRGVSIDWKAIEATSDERLITAMAMICPFAAAEKQSLLQTDGLAERAKLLIDLVEMALLERPGSGTVQH